MSASSIIYVVDLPKMEAFYTGAIGLVRIERGETFRILESEGLELVLIQAPPRMADAITLTNPPRRRSEAPTKLVFAVRDIAAVRTRSTEFGGAVDAAEDQRLFLSTLRCDGIDPEGNVFQLRQLGIVTR